MTDPRAFGPPRLSPAIGASAVGQFLRRNLLLLAATAVYLLIALLVLAQMDLVYYDRAKSEAVGALIENDRLLNDPSLDSLAASTNQYLRTRVGFPGRPQEMHERSLRIQREALEGLFVRVFEAEPVVWRIVVRDKAGEVLLEQSRRERLAALNDASNNLFSRQWSKTLRRMSRDRDQGVWLGTLEVHYTTPKGEPEIEALTRRWRARAAMIAAGLLAFYLVVLFGILLPVRSVIKALDKGPQVASPLIPAPRTLLEKYFNNLARDANLSLLSSQLREFIREHPDAEHRDVLDAAPGMVAGLFPVRGFRMWMLREGEGAQGWTIESAHGLDGGPEGDVEFAARIRALAPELARPGAEEAVLAWEDDRGRSREHLALAVWSEEGRLDLLAAGPLPHRAYARQWWSRLHRSVAGEVRFALGMLAEQRRLIMMEKRKANISLSRNLGHDLTNIIATSKLELMTVRALLSKSPEELAEKPQRQEIFQEALAALLDNTRFLQEIVNLYRSFTYMSHPRYERVAPAQLVREVADLFQLSISSSVVLEVDAEEDAPAMAVEPRLLKLALFNLLSNASDALKRAATAESPEGRVRIRARSEGGTLEIAVRDSGPGIRDETGRLLAGEELARIFELGYTTKESGSGEGLGLNWVQQIVRDFHDGEIEARNPPEGGAEFVLRLPTRDLLPSRDLSADRPADCATTDAAPPAPRSTP